MQVTWVNKEDAQKIWPMVEPFLDSALKRYLPVWFTSDLLEAVKKDEMQLWIITSNKEEKLYGACLSQLIPYPRAKVCNVVLLGGKDWKKWKEDISSAIEAFAKSQNCDFLQVIGRRAWSYFDGSFESAVVINKILN